MKGEDLYEDYKMRMKIVIFIYVPIYVPYTCSWFLNYNPTYFFTKILKTCTYNSQYTSPDLKSDCDFFVFINLVDSIHMFSVEMTTCMRRNIKNPF